MYTVISIYLLELRCIMADNNHSSGFYFKITEVAKQVGVVPATIRNWEKSGLITVRRTPSGYRIFDLNDIEYLKKIKQKSKEENIGMGGIRRLTSQPDKLLSMRDDKDDAAIPEQDASQRLLGSKWKEYRLQRNYSLEDVSDLVGISASYLSKIENGQANVSYEVLQKLAAFYGENLLYYLSDSSEESPTVRYGESEPFEIGIKGLQITSLIARKKHTLSALLYTVEPGCERTDNSSHNGEEFVYVLSGKVEFILDSNQFSMLSAGDSISFSSTTPHRWRNRSNRPAKLLWIYTPLEAL